MELDLERQPCGRGSIDISGTCELGIVENAPATVEVTGTLTVDNLESRLLVNGVLDASGHSCCDRCLQGFRLNFDVAIDVVVLRDTESSEGEGDTWVIQQKTGIVDLTGVVREAASLAMPAKLVCRENCRGSCSGCGADLNQEDCRCRDKDVDPRWAGLPD